MSRNVNVNVSIDVDQSDFNSSLMRIRDAVRHGTESIAAASGYGTPIIRALIPGSSEGQRPTLIHNFQAMGASAIAWQAQNVVAPMMLTRQRVEAQHMQMLGQALSMPSSINAAIPSTLSDMHIPISYRLARGVGSMFAAAPVGIGGQLLMDAFTGGFKKPGALGRYGKAALGWNGISFAYIAANMAGLVPDKINKGIAWINNKFSQGLDVLTMPLLGKEGLELTKQGLKDFSNNIIAQQLGKMVMSPTGIGPGVFASNDVYSAFVQQMTGITGKVAPGGSRISPAMAMRNVLLWHPELSMAAQKVFRAGGFAKQTDLIFTPDQKALMAGFRKEFARVARSDYLDTVDYEMALISASSASPKDKAEAVGRITSAVATGGPLSSLDPKRYAELKTSHVMDDYYANVIAFRRKGKSFYTRLGEHIGTGLTESKRWGRDFVKELKSRKKYDYYMNKEELAAAGGKRAIFQKAAGFMTQYATTGLGNLTLFAATQGGVRSLSESNLVMSLAGGIGAAMSDPFAYINYQLNGDRILRRLGGGTAYKAVRATFESEVQLIRDLVPEFAEGKSNQELMQYILMQRGMGRNEARAAAGQILGVGRIAYYSRGFKRLDESFMNVIKDNPNIPGNHLPYVTSKAARYMNSKTVDLVMSYKHNFGAKASVSGLVSYLRKRGVRISKDLAGSLINTSGSRQKYIATMLNYAGAHNEFISTKLDSFIKSSPENYRIIEQAFHLNLKDEKTGQIDVQNIDRNFKRLAAIGSLYKAIGRHGEIKDASYLRQLAAMAGVTYEELANKSKSELMMVRQASLKVHKMFDTRLIKKGEQKDTEEYMKNDIMSAIEDLNKSMDRFTQKTKVLVRSLQ